MSRLNAAKIAQGYVQKAEPRTCVSCKNFTCDRIQTHAATSWAPNGFYEDKNLRCVLGGFAVKKMGTCDEWERKR